MVGEYFSALSTYYVDVSAMPVARGQLSAYSVPVILVFFNGKETVREARYFGISELATKIDRYYSRLVFLPIQLTSSPSCGLSQIESTSSVFFDSSILAPKSLESTDIRVRAFQAKRRPLCRHGWRHSGGCG